MKIWLGLATPDTALQRHFGEKKASVVHRDALSRGYWGKFGVSVATNVYAPEGEPHHLHLANFIASEADKASFCVFLVDKRWENSWIVAERLASL